MIFNDKYNRAIDLMKITSEEFSQTYNSIIEKIPSPILKKCEKCRRFEKEYDDLGYSYSLGAGMDGDGAIELCYTNWKNRQGFEIYVAEVTEKKIKKLKVIDEDERYGYMMWEFGGLDIRKGDNELRFSFELKRVEQNRYQVKMQKEINNEIHDDPIVKEFTQTELLEKLNVKKSRR